MTTRYTPTHIHLAGDSVSDLTTAARWRRRIGLLLLLVGSAWLGLSLTGHAADLPFPIRWLDVISSLLGFLDGLRS